MTVYQSFLACHDIDSLKGTSQVFGGVSLLGCVWCLTHVLLGMIKVTEEYHSGEMPFSSHPMAGCISDRMGQMISSWLITGNVKLDHLLEMLSARSLYSKIYIFNLFLLTKNVPQSGMHDELKSTLWKGPSLSIMWNSIKKLCLFSPFIFRKRLHQYVLVYFFFFWGGG